MFQFYGALYGPVLCYLETFNSFVVLKRRSLDIVSLASGEVTGRINPQLRQNATVIEHFGFFRASPHGTSLSALCREEDNTWIVSWDLTSASLKLKAKVCLEASQKVLNCEFDEVLQTVQIMVGSRAEGMLVLYDFKIEGETTTTLSIVKLEVPCDFPSKGKLISQRLNRKDSFVLVSKRNILVANFRKNQVSSKSFDHKDQFEKVAVSEKGKVAAFGCRSGRIYVIKHIHRSSDEWIISVCHWHSEVVNALTFNKEETILLSGGNEKVLVSWPLNDLQRNNFIPRLPSSISHIHTKTGTDEILCVLKDNSFVVVSYSGKIQSHFQLFVNDPCMSEAINNSHSNVKVFGNSIIANSHPGMLQFVSIPSGKVSMELDVSGFNNVSSKEKITEWRISTFDINSNGYLCTLEECNTKEINTTVLKFWKFQSENFTQMQSVTGVKICSNCPQIISRNQCNDFVVLLDSLSIWRLGEQNFETMLLLSKADSMPRHLSFSLDGSVMIACFSNLLQLWSGSTNLQTRNYLATTKPCSSAVFGKCNLTATCFLVNYEDSFEIRDVAKKESLLEAGISLENVFAVETFPAFVGFCSSKSSVIVVSGQLLDIFAGISFVCQLFECHAKITKGVPFMLQNGSNDTNDSESKEELEKYTWLKDHCLTLITNDSRFYALSSPRLKEPFSLLQASDFLELQSSNEDALKSESFLGTNVSDKLGQLSLNKFISHELNSYSSHLLPKVDTMLEHILANTTAGAESDISLTNEMGSDKDSGIADEESDDEIEMAPKTAIDSAEKTNRSNEVVDIACKIELLTTVVVPESYDV